MNYIIVQAGGKGSRMQVLTRNKPKALVPVDNLPMIFHLFKKYPDKKFIVIGDYKYDVLKRYLEAFATVDYQLVCAAGYNGTCAGLSEALSFIPDHERFMLIWCDLILPEDYEIPNSTQNIIGISKDFTCRWKYEDGKFAEEKSAEHGVAGHFIFKDKSYLKDIPAEGEFVRWLQSQGYIFEEQGLYRTHEYGLYEEWSKVTKKKCRPFNRIDIIDNKFVKSPLDEQGRRLAVREVSWYKQLQSKQFPNLPVIYEYSPLCMERIDGNNIYEYNNISIEEKKQILSQIVNCLKSVHEIESVPVDAASYYDAYIGKTFQRLQKVQWLVPFANDPYVQINGRKCRNVFYHREELEERVSAYMPKEFKLIHGDCTFSNIMLRKDKTPVLIDPRGYFGNTELYGDVAYDWVKLYYSIFSNYDQFNLKRFHLAIDSTEVSVQVDSNNWEDMESVFFELIGDEISPQQMKLLLAITWLSLTTYAWEDYDSICGAFYLGLYYLEDALK